MSIIQRTAATVALTAAIVVASASPGAAAEDGSAPIPPPCQVDGVGITCTTPTGDQAVAGVGVVSYSGTVLVVAGAGICSAQLGCTLAYPIAGTSGGSVIVFVPAQAPEIGPFGAGGFVSLKPVRACTTVLVTGACVPA